MIWQILVVAFTTPKVPAMRPVSRKPDPLGRDRARLLSLTKKAIFHDAMHVTTSVRYPARKFSSTISKLQRCVRVALKLRTDMVEFVKVEFMRVEFIGAWAQEPWKSNRSPTLKLVSQRRHKIG